MLDHGDRRGGNTGLFEDLGRDAVNPGFCGPVQCVYGLRGHCKRRNCREEYDTKSA